MNSYFTQTITQQSSRPFIIKLDHFAHGVQAYGTLRNETKRNGTLRNGTLRNGTLRNGTLRNGTLRNGTLRNGYNTMLHHTLSRVPRIPLKAEDL